MYISSCFSRIVIPPRKAVHGKQCHNFLAPETPSKSGTNNISCVFMFKFSFFPFFLRQSHVAYLA